MDAGNVSRLISRFEQLSTTGAQPANRKSPINKTPPQNEATQKSAAVGVKAFGKSALAASTTIQGHVNKLTPKEGGTRLHEVLNGKNSSLRVLRQLVKQEHTEQSQSQGLKKLSQQVQHLAKDAPRSAHSPDFCRQVKQTTAQIAEQLFQAKTPKEQSLASSLLSELGRALDSNPALKKEIHLQLKVARGLVSNFDKAELKPTLSEATASLCQAHGVTGEDIMKEARLMGTDDRTALLKMTNRLISYKKGLPNTSEQTPSLAQMMERTGYELSVIKAVDKVFRSHVSGKSTEISHKIGEFTAIIAKDNKVIIEERVLGAGGFKAAILASDFFAMKSPEERGQLVTLKPKELVIAQSATQVGLKVSVPPPAGPASKNESSKSPSPEEDYSSVVIRDDSPEEEDYSSVVVKNDGPGEEEYSSVVIQDDSVKGSPPVQVSNDAIKEVKTPASPIPSFIAATRRQQEPTILDPHNKFLTLAQMKQLLNQFKEQPDKENLVTSLKARIEVRERENAALEAFADVERSEKDDYEYEIAITKTLQGPGVIKMHSVVDIASGNKMMVQEAAGLKLPSIPGVRNESLTTIDLNQMRKANKKNLLTSGEQVKMLEFYREGFEGVVRMHSMGYIHRDLKEENILITKDGHGVLADFGSVVAAKDDPRKAEYIGTPAYSAPETFKHAENETWNFVNEKADVWSCGMIVYNSFVGHLSTHPAVNGREAQVLFQVNKSLDQRANLYNSSYPEPEDKMSFEHLVWSATQLDPEKRPTMAQFTERFAQISSKIKSDLNL